jgi:pyruvate,water dikinase
MATVVPVDEYVADEWYPGFTPAYDHAPWVVEPVRPFQKEDESRFWYLDFHWPRGLTPMGFVWNEDGYAWGTQLAAESLPLPPGHGIAVRMAGTHTYGGEIPVRSRQEMAARTRRFAEALPAFVSGFGQLWEKRRDEIDADWDSLRRADLCGTSLPELAEHLRRTRAHHKRAFEIHFEIMYPLLANYAAFHGLCRELGIDPAEIAKFLQGYDTKIMETDRELWRLTEEARAAGLRNVFAGTEPKGLKEALTAAGGSAAAWLSKFDSFLDVYGWRTEGISDVALPSWVENPTSPLGTIKTYLQMDTDHDFAKAHQAAVEEREAAVDMARSRLTRQEQATFDAALASCQAANFAWWNEEHDHYIDLRAMLPMRRACLAVAEAVGADRPDDTLYLFWPEIMSVLTGDRRYSEFRAIIEDRRQYFSFWHDRRHTMPKVLGTVPDSVHDPILIEIFGLNRHFLHVVCEPGSDADAKTLTGVPAARGVGRGVARVLRNADELHRIRPGDVLVCESTSPNWTLAFAKIAACVCDCGGVLSHAAIVGREYGVPTVTAVGLATVVIHDGDEVEVDGTMGRVRVYRRAARELAGDAQ